MPSVEVKYMSTLLQKKKKEKRKKKKYQGEDFNCGWQMNTTLFRNAPNSTTDLMHL